MVRLESRICGCSLPVFLVHDVGKAAGRGDVGGETGGGRGDVGGETGGGRVGDLGSRPKEEAGEAGKLGLIVDGHRGGTRGEATYVHTHTQHRHIRTHTSPHAYVTVSRKRMRSAQNSHLW